MNEEQKKLEGLLLKHIEKQVTGAPNRYYDVPQSALALVELWKATKTIYSSSLRKSDIPL